MKVNRSGGYDERLKGAAQPALAANLVLRIAAVKPGVDRFEFFQQITGLLHGLFDHLPYDARIIDQRFLRQIADRRQ